MGVVEVRRDQFAKYYGELKANIGSPAWVIDVQAKAVNDLGPFKGFVSEDDYTKALVTLQKGLGLEHVPERFIMLMELDRLSDLRRALRAGALPRPSPQRLAGEEIYPTDTDTWIGGYLLYSQPTEVPTAWHFWTGLTCIATALRRQLYIDRQAYIVWPNLYVILVGSTAMRKSVCMDVAIDVLQRANWYLDKEDCEKHNRIRVSPQKCTPERFLQMIASFDTTETDKDGIMSDIQTASHALLYCDELVNIFGKSQFGSDTWAHNLTTLYMCPTEFDCSTITRGNEVLRNVSISMMGGSTVDWIRSSVTENFFGGGFLGKA